MPGPEAVRNKELDLAVDQLARLVAEQLLGAAVDETYLALRARPARPRPVPTPAAPGNASPRFAARSRPLAHFSLTTPVTVTDGAQPGLSVLAAPRTSRRQAVQMGIAGACRLPVTRCSSTVRSDGRSASASTADGHPHRDPGDRSKGLDGAVPWELQRDRETSPWNGTRSSGGRRRRGGENAPNVPTRKHRSRVDRRLDSHADAGV